MSYCRWSCLNFYSDVYVYADVNGGWTTHVAGNRPPKPGAPESGSAAMMKAIGEGIKDGEALASIYKEADAAWEAWKNENSSVEITHPEAGETFNHATPGECADNLERLRGEGFTVPQFAIDELRQEHAEDFAPHTLSP